MLVIRDLRVRVPPTIEGDIVHVSGSSGTSQVYVETESFIAVDFMESNGTIQFHMFLDGNRVEWDKLSDEQRMLLRISIKVYLNDRGWGRVTLTKYYCGEYEDSRYYTLEALCD